MGSRERDHLLTQYRTLCFDQRSTETVAGREPFFPHCVTADYVSLTPTGVTVATPQQVGFGAVLGWCEPLGWWIDLAASIGPGFRRLGLLGIEHQAGGHHCIPWFIVGIQVAIADAYVDFAANLVRDYYHADGGHFWNPGADKIALYLERLRDSGLSAEKSLASGHPLMESVYPIDASDRNLSGFLADFDGAMGRVQPLVSRPEVRGRLRVYVLADNSD